jgi:anthranilate synthase
MLDRVSSPIWWCCRRDRAAPRISIAPTIKKIRARELPVFGVCLGLAGAGRELWRQSARTCRSGAWQAVAHPGVAERDHILRPAQRGDGWALSFDFADYATLPKEFRVTAETDDRVVMAIEHESEPVAAVQFHPESIMTLGQDAGMRMIENVVAHLARGRR